MSAPTPSLFVADEEAMIRLGEDIAMALRPGDRLLFDAPMGAGKTTLSRAILRAASGQADLEVPSPTYTLIQPYDIDGRRFLHADLYRLGDESELGELGLDDEAEAILLIEWPERAPQGFFNPAMSVTIAFEGEGRRVSLNAEEGGASGLLSRLIHSFSVRHFLKKSLGDARRLPMQADASARRYERLETASQKLVLMDAPRMPDGPPVRDGLPYSRIAHLAEDVVPFVAVCGALERAGLQTPHVIASDLEAGLLVLDDLGREGVLDGNRRPIPDRYCLAAEALALFHAKAPETLLPVSGASSPYAVPAYDRPALEIELSLAIDWYAPHFGLALDAAQREHFLTAWDGPLRQLETAENALVLRDVHSPNLIFLEHRQGTDRIAFIDHQDAVIGPSAYDVASLAEDARVDVPESLRAAIVSAYKTARVAQAAHGARPFAGDSFDAAYAIMAAQRATKIIGIFCRLHDRDGKAHYLAHLPRVEAALARALRHPALIDVRAMMTDLFGQRFT